MPIRIVCFAPRGHLDRSSYHFYTLFRGTVLVEVMVWQTGILIHITFDVGKIMLFSERLRD
jgi:hypothetical protein